jgi:Na+/H+ antiporter NhaA
MEGAQTSGGLFSERTAWARNLETPLREFLRTETGSAVFLLAATVVALVWVNIDASSYRTVWQTQFSLHIGGAGVSQDLRHWVNSGLMTFFFLVVGLEARREFDMGELRDRRRVALPLLAGLVGMALPIGIFLAVNAGHSSVRGWGAAMSTDTAFALGMLALLGPSFPDRLRAFLLTVLVVDDLVALVVIAFVYPGHFVLAAFLVALGIFVATLLVRAAGIDHGLVYVVLGLAAWVALFKSGVEPVVVGLAGGLLTYAYPAARGDLERAAGYA